MQGARAWRDVEGRGGRDAQGGGGRRSPRARGRAGRRRAISLPPSPSPPPRRSLRPQSPQPDRPRARPGPIAPSARGVGVHHAADRRAAPRSRRGAFVSLRADRGRRPPPVRPAPPRDRGRAFRGLRGARLARRGARSVVVRSRSEVPKRQGGRSVVARHPSIRSPAGGGVSGAEGRERPGRGGGDGRLAFRVERVRERRPRFPPARPAEDAPRRRSGARTRPRPDALTKRSWLPGFRPPASARLSGPLGIVSDAESTLAFASGSCVSVSAAVSCVPVSTFAPASGCCVRLSAIALASGTCDSSPSPLGLGRDGRVGR